MGFIEIIKEKIRRGATGDSWYVEELPYALELVIHGAGSQVFVLPIGPDGYSVKRVFRQTVTPTLGGVVAEERGLLWREIAISCSFALEPRKGYDTTGTTYVKGYRPEALPVGGDVALSGPGWTRRLIRNIIEHYAALKADPDLSRGTYLVWHDMKMDDHWVVVPSDMGVNRTTARRMRYPFSLNFRAVGDSDSIIIPPPKSSLLDKIRNAVGQVAAAVDLGASAIQEGSAILGDVRVFAAQIDSVLDSYTTMLLSAQDFLDGVTDVLSIGAIFVSSLAQALEAQNALMETAKDLPASVRANYQRALDAVHAVGAQRSAFGETYKTQAERQRGDEAATARKASPESLGAAEAAGPPNTANDMEARALRSTDAASMAAGGASLPSERTFAEYQGQKEYAVQEGDTLQAIAARELGDGALWYDIALVNGLVSPYVSPAGGPGVATVGDVIVVPTLAPNPSTSVASARQGTEPSADLMGTDLRLVPSSGARPGRPLVDLAVDEGTLRDFLAIEGFANYEQALQMRLWTERGSMPTSPNYGVRRIVGYGEAAADLTVLQLGIRETLLADSRTRQVGRIQVAAEDDALTVDVDVVPVGAESARSVAAFV